MYPTGNGVSQKHERTAREYHTGLQEVTAERIKCCAVLLNSQRLVLFDVQNPTFHLLGIFTQII